MFDRVFVINLARTPDRIVQFRRGMPATIITSNPQRWDAVDGSKATLPKSWTAGRPMWGAYRSHLQILEHCLMNDIGSYCVFEDDACFRSDFDAQFALFSQHLPGDWGMAFLGGQLLDTFASPPEKMNDHVYRLGRINRMHAVAVHSRAYGPLYRHLNDLPFAPNEAFDIHIGRLVATKEINVYGPAYWLCGQREGTSTITNNHNSEQYWNDPGPTWAAFDMLNQPETLLTSTGLTHRPDPTTICPQMS